MPDKSIGGRGAKRGRTAGKHEKRYPVGPRRRAACRRRRRRPAGGPRPARLHRRAPQGTRPRRLRRQPGPGAGRRGPAAAPAGGRGPGTTLAAGGGCPGGTGRGGRPRVHQRLPPAGLGRLRRRPRPVRRGCLRPQRPGAGAAGAGGVRQRQPHRPPQRGQRPGRRLRRRPRQLPGGRRLPGRAGVLRERRREPVRQAGPGHGGPLPPTPRPVLGGWGRRPAR